MAKGNTNPTPPPSSSNPNPTPSPTPSPTGTGGGGPTGNSGFSMNDSSMQGLQSKAGDLGSRLSAISSGLRGLNFSGNALGPIGLFAVPALNASNDNAISQADKGAKAFTDVQSKLKATLETHVQTDTKIGQDLKSVDTSTNAKPPPGAANTTLGNNTQGGPKVQGPGTIAGGTGYTGGGQKGPGGGPVAPPPNIKGGTGPAGTGGSKGPGGGPVAPPPNVKGGTGPVGTGGSKGPAGGPSVGAPPNIKGGAGPVGGPTGPANFVPKDVKVPTGPTAGPIGGGPIGATPGATPGSRPNTPGGGAKGPANFVPKDVKVPTGPAAGPIGGPVGGAPGSKPNTPGGGAKGPANFTPKDVKVPTGPSAGPVGGTPGSNASGGGAKSPANFVPKDVKVPTGPTTPPGPQSAVTSPSTGTGPRSFTPTAGATPGAGMGAAPPMAPGASPSAGAPSDRSTKYNAPGSGGKGVFDAPKPPTPDTITKAPKDSASTPGSAPGAGATPKPGGVPATPGATPGSAPSVTPGATPGSTPTTPGQQTAVTAPSQSGPRAGAPTPTAPAANPGAMPPAAPPAAAPPPGATGTDRTSKYTGGTGAGKGVFDAPKPPTPDNTITRAPGTSPSTPPPAPKPTSFTPPPATVPPTSTSTPSPTPATPPVNTPGANPNTAPPTQARPTPAAPPVNAPSPNAPSSANTPSPKPDAAPSTQTPKADTAPPAQTRPAPSPTPSPSTNVPPVNAPSPKPETNVPPANTPPVNAPKPDTNVPPANTASPKPETNAPPAQTKPTPDTNTAPPAQTRPAPAPAVNAPPANVPTANVPAANTPNPNSPNTNTPPPAAPAAGPRAVPGGWMPDTGIGQKTPAAAPVTDTTNVNAMWPPAGPRPGSVPNVPGVVGPPQGIFAPNRPAADALRPIAEASPPAEPRPTPTTPQPEPPAVQPEKKPFEPPKPGPSPDPFPVEPIMASPNLLNLLDPRGYPGTTKHNSPGNYKADAAWPATTIDGKPWADLQNLTPEESRKWIDNLRNVLASKPDGAFFWSGNYYDSDGNRISVMNEAEYMAKADGRNTLEGTLDDKAIKLPGWGNTSPEGKAVWDSVSASLAHGASGDVYVLLGPSRRPDNVFHMTEFPILQQNPNVNRVITIDVHTKEETVIYTANTPPAPDNTDTRSAPPVPGDIGTSPDADIKPDTDTDKSADTNASAQNTQPQNTPAPNTTADNGPTPTRDAPPAPPPAPPVRESNLNPDGTRKDVPKVGAPPAMTPPTPESHQGKDVLTDESWRHDPAKTADWSNPSNPADRSTWADRRNDTDVRTVDVTVHDVRTDSTPSNIKSYQGLINYDLRRIETTPGNFVQEYTVKVHVDPAANVDPDAVQQVKDNATNGVNSLLNQGFRLPSGDQFHLNLEFTDNAADAHTTIKVDPKNPNVDQTHWNPDTSPEVLAHETLHYLGIPDEYKDTSRVFQQHDTNSGVHQNDGGLMGADVHLPDPGIRPRHLWLIENTANSQVMVPDTTINPAGPATVPPPADWKPNPSTETAPTPATDPRPDADTRAMPKRDAWDSDSDAETAPEQNKRPKHDGAPFDPGNVAGPSTIDSDAMDVDQDSQVDDLTNALNDLSLSNVQYNQAFANLANDGFDLPTKDNYLGKLKESVEADKRPSFVVNMIVSHAELGTINDVINSITADAGPTGKDMVFVVGVNGPNGSAATIDASITQANNSVSGRPEPIALVPLPTFDPAKGFPFGTMRNETMHSPATTFAIGAMNGKDTHPYISFQDFDTGSRKVTGDQKDIFNHFKDSLNPPGAGPIRPVLYSGGYRVGDPAALVNDTQTRIDKERAKINNDPKLSADKKAEKLEELRVAEQQIRQPDFAEKFQQAMSDDMDARSRQKDSAPLLPYSPEPNLFIDANVTVVAPDVKFSKDANEFGGLSQSINQFAGNEIAEIHQNQLPKPEFNEDVKQAKAQLEADIAAQGGKPSPAQAQVLASLDAEIKAKEARAAADPGFKDSSAQLVVDAGIEVDLKTNRNPYRGENFTSDFVNGAVGTDLSRLALGFAKSEGKSWPQSHVALTSVTSRMYAGVPDATGKLDPQADRAAKSDVSGAKIRDEFQDKKPGKGGAPNPKNKPHSEREAQQLKIHGDQPSGGWNPSEADAKKLGVQDKNTLSTAVSAPVAGHGHMGIDPTAKNEKMAAMLNLALSSNTSNVTRTFGTLEHGVLPIADPPRPDGMFNAVHDAMVKDAKANPPGAKKGKPAPEIKSATDLRAGAIQKGSIASPAITKQIANFRQEHGLDNGHLVNALIEPNAAPQADTTAQEIDADKIADNAKAAKAEELAAKLLATEIGRPLTIHGPNGPQTFEPFYEPRPETNSKSKPADIKKAENWRPPAFPPPLELDAHPQPNGKTHFTPHDLGEGPSHRAAPPAPDTQTPDVETRPAPPRPTPNPVIPMTTTAPQPVGQVPDTNLPSFFQDNKALGSITPTNVRGADAVVGEIQGLKPDDQARIKNALENDFETFLGNGRNFQVKIGNAWFEANVRAEMHADANTAVQDAADTKVDKNFQAAAATTTTNTIATANDVGASATAGVAMGPYGSLGGKAALATPAVSQATTNTTTEQRAIKGSDDGSKNVTVPVSFEITVTDAAGNPRQFATLDTGTDVTLQVPADLSTIVDSGKTSGVVTPADAAWGTKVENAVPEAVVVNDSGKAFDNVAEKLHPSITKVGSPGREALQNFLSPTSIRNNLPAMLGGFVTSPDLISPHASKGGAVQMTATLKDAKLVGTHDNAALDLKDTSAWGSSVSAATKTGFDVTAGFGGNIGVPGQVGGTVGATATYSARTAEGVNAGTSSSHKTGIGVKNETGLYEVTAEVEVRTPAGDSVKIPVTTHMRMGLHEAGAVGLPTPDGTRNTITDPATADTKFLPPYLADTLAAGNAKVGEFVPATKVQGQVEGALRDLPGFGKLLPQWNNPDANPRSSKGRSFADVAEQLASQRKLTANLSPAALKANMDSLLGPGVQVQLKNSGKTTNTYVNVTVKAKLSNPKHLGQADARPVSDSTTTGPKLDANTSTTKGWTGGVQGRVNIPVKTGVASLTPAPQVGASYSHSWTDKTTAGPAVSSTSSNPGSADAQVFQQDVEFEVEITSFTRPRTWVRNIVPGAPGFHSPEVKTVARTGAGLDKIDGKVNLWVSDGSTLKTDPGNGFKPGDPQPTKIENSPTVKDLLNPADPRPKSPEFLHVEAVANTTALRDQAIDALNRAANGDSALTVPGTASRAQIDKMFSPENIKANLQRLVETGIQEQGLKYDRRVTDRSGAIGMSVKLGEAKLVSISDTTGTDNSVSGGYKAGASSSTSRSVDLTAGVNVPVRPNVTPPPAGTPSQPSGSGGAAVTGKVTPWSDTRTESNEIGGNVDRGRTTPGDARTVLVQIDAEFTIVGESRAGNLVHGGTPNAEGVTVTMPKSVFVRVSEDVARELGALPTVTPNVPKPDFPKMAPPSTVAVGEPGALGLSNVESVPNLSGVVNALTNQLATNTKKFGSDALIPDSVLKDSMSNLQRIVDLNSPTSVKAMIDSALDGGVPLLVHQPGTFGKDSYQVTLRAKTGEPKFDQVVNDGVDMSHNAGGSRKESSGQGRGTGWGVGVRAPGLAAPGSANPKVSGTAGASVGANIGGSTSSSVTTSTSEAFSHTRTASGPAAQYTVPIEFELVVEKGAKEIAKAESGRQEMVVRTHADNQKIAGGANPQPYMSAASRRGSEFGTPAATSAFQQDSRATQLPPTASVENLRGAKDLRDAAVKALTEAGAGKGLTGKGTGAVNSLFSTLSPENLQPHLPSMLSGPLDVPGLKEAALTFGQDADVKVYAKLVNPQLGSLSDSVKIENPLTTKTTETSSEAKVSETADVSVGLAQGSAAVKQGTDPKDTVNFGTGGVEARHAGEDSAAVSGGPAQAEGGNVKPKDAARTGLVQFDVEYRVVATIGGKTGVVDLTVPGSAGVRMPATEVETVLKHDLPDALKDAQTEVKKAADDWRTAEQAVETARHEAQDAINEAAAVLARTDQPVGAAATALNTAIDAHLDAEAKLPPLEAAAATTQADVARTRATIQELNPQITSLSQDALSTKDALDDAEINGAPQAELDRLGQEADAAHTALTDAQQQLTDAHAELDAQRKAAADARAALQAQQQVVAQADRARADAETAHQQLAGERAAAEQAIKDAETKLDDARRAADAKQQDWWDAKAKVDREVEAFNTAEASTSRPAPANADAPPKTVHGGGAPPALTPPTPESHQGKDVITDESWRHDPAKTASWSQPNNPADRSTWAYRRDNKNVRTVNQVVHDVRTDSTPSKLKSYKGLINYDLRRIETSPGQFVQEYTVKVHVDPAVNVNPDVVQQVKDNATNGVNNLLNQGFRLPSGDQFHLNLEFTDNKADAHTTIKVDPKNPNVDQTHWNPDTSPEVLAHETLHYLGIPDEYKDSSRVFQQHDTNSGVHQNDGGLMGADVHLPDPGIRPRHLWLIERTANSQVMVPDTRLEPPGPATVPVPEHLLKKPATTATPAAAPTTTPDSTPDADTRPMPKRDTWDSDSDAETAPEQNKRARHDGDAGTAGPSDSQTDALADQLSTMSISDIDPGTRYNAAFASLGNGRIEVPTKDTYLDHLKTSVEQNRRPSFVISIIVSHNNLGDINDVIDAITADAGPIADDMVFVIGVNGRTGANTGMDANIDAANNAVANRTEPIALVPMEFNDKSFPYGKMRNQTMQSSATKFAVGALNGKGTHPYLSIQDFDTGSRQVPSGTDVFTHFTKSLNPPEIGPIRPLMHGGGYRVGDRNALITDIQHKIAAAQTALDADTSLKPKDKADKQRELRLAREHISPENRDAFIAKFEQAMNDDMHARVRQADSAPLTPYWPEPNLFIDATVPLVDPSVKFSDGLGEFNGLGQSMNSFAGKEIVEIHQTKLPAPDTTRALIEARTQLEADIAARGGERNPKEVRALAEIDAELAANQDPATAKAANDAVVDAAISVDLQTNRHPLRGATFSTDFVDGAVGTDLSRLAFDFAKDDGKSWPQSHVELTTVAGRTFGGDPGQASKKAKFETSPADIRKQFQDSRTGRPTKANPHKPHDKREPQQLVEHEYSFDEKTGTHTRTGSQGGWNPSRVDALKLGWEDKNTLNKAISAEVPEHGHMGVDPQVDTSTVYPPERVKPAGSKKPLPPREEHELGHIDPATKQQKTATVLNTALSDNNSDITRTFGTFEAALLHAGPPRPNGLYDAVHSALADESGGPVPSAAELRANTIRQGALASPGVTTQIADFRQVHGLENGHLVNAMIEPGPTPRTDFPPDFPRDSTYVHPVDNTGTPGSELTEGQRAEQDSIDADERAAEKDKADKAEFLAVQLVATELNRPITVHGPNSAETTVLPLHDLQPEVLTNSTQKDKGKAAAWQPTPLSGPALHIDRHPDPDGKTRYTKHDPANPPGSTGSSDADMDVDVETRPAPPPPPAPVVTELDNRLAELTSDAMATASPMAKLVEMKLQSDPLRYVQWEAGVHLLHASVVLDTRTAEIAEMIRDHGVEAVARTFNKAFERPIIETAQLQQFSDLTDPGNRARFDEWAHQLWSTVNGADGLNTDPDQVAADIFNHDKGYNRAFNFAQEAALAGIMGAPPLADVVSSRPAPADDASSQAAWVYQVFAEAQVIAADGSDRASQFGDLVEQHRADLESKLGPLTEQRVAEMRQELVDLVMLDDDIAEPSAPPAVSAPLPAPFGQQQAGVQQDHFANTLRQLRYLNENVLVRQPVPPTTGNGLYAAIGQARNIDPAVLRQQVVSLAATHQAVSRAVADFTGSRTMHQGHLSGALVENVNWQMQPDARENTGAGNARDLVGHLIATQLSVNVRIHQGGGNPVLLRPMGPPFEETVDIEMVLNGRQVTYRPQGLHQDESML